MKAITKASRFNIALQVIQYLNNGITEVEACRAVGNLVAFSTNNKSPF